MTKEYLRQLQNPHNRRRATTRLTGLVSIVAVLLMSACGGSSSGGGTTVPPPPPPPPPPTNSAPTAAAGADVTVSASIAVQLDGSASSDADGDAITYAWSFVFVPSGSLAVFDDDTAAQPRFTPDVAGDYTIELVVSDGTVTSNTDDIVVTADDNTVTQTIGAAGGQIVSLDGVVTLDIPAGALAADEAISLTFVPGDQRASYLGPEFDGIGGTASVYDMGPDGLTFSVPVTATVAAPDNPVVDANTLGGAMQLLLTSDAGTLDLLDEMTLIADADSASTTVVGELSHFSPLVWYIPDAESALTWQITGVPDQIAKAQTVSVRSTVESLLVTLISAAYAEDGLAPAFRRIDEQITFFQMDQLGIASDFMTEVDYGCFDAGTALYIGQLLAGVESSGSNTSPISDALDDNPVLTVKAQKTVECVDTDPGPSARLTPGLNSAPAAMTKLEALQVGYLASLIVLSGVGDVSSHPLALFAGAAGNVLYDLEDGQVLRDDTDPASTDPAFGAVLASSTLAGGGVAGMIYEHGSGTFGGLRCDYDEANQEFSSFCQLQSGTGYDAVPVGNTHETTQVSYATNFSVGVLELDPVTEVYEYNDFPTATNAFFGTPYSAVRLDLAGPLLVLTNSRPDFSTLNLVDPDGTVTLVETFFDEDARKLRCTGSLCGITLFSDSTGQGAMRFVAWDGMNAPTVAATTIPVGDGPVGTDPIQLTNGNVLWGSTGFNDNTITLTETTPTGGLVFSNTDPAPTGCLKPAHPVWFIPEGASPNEAQLVFTCFDSNQFGVVDIANDPQQGFSIVPLQ